MEFEEQHAVALEVGDRFLRLNQVMRITGLSRNALQRQELAGIFPPKYRISSRAVAWKESEVKRWMASRELASGTGDPER